MDIILTNIEIDHLYDAIGSTVTGSLGDLWSDLVLWYEENPDINQPDDNMYNEKIFKLSKQYKSNFKYKFCDSTLSTSKNGLDYLNQLLSLAHHQHISGGTYVTLEVL